MIVEGSKVTYAGDDPFTEVGSVGKVIALSGSAAHVQWASGSIDLVEQHELLPAHQGSMAPTTLAASFDNALDMPGIGIQVRATYDEHGEEGLLNTLAESGHLAVLSEYVDEAVNYLASRIRIDPTFRDVLAVLEPDEASALVGKVASQILTDRITEED